MKCKCGMEFTASEAGTAYDEATGMTHYTCPDCGLYNETT